MISLDPITEDNRKFYQTFEDLYVSNLQQYQSRIYPNVNAEFVKWFYIKQNNAYIGSIWIEKETINAPAIMGIFIAFEKYRNKGIGKNAIRLLLDEFDKLCIDDKVFFACPRAKY